MSQERHTEIRIKLDRLVERDVIARWGWDSQGVRYLIWAPGEDDPSVHTLMATEALLLGVELVDALNMRHRPTFVADPDDGTVVRVQWDAEVERAG